MLRPDGLIESLIFHYSIAPAYTISAAKEIIISAGSINTPQLLMLSGIGDSKQLSALGIPTVVNSPDVGKNLQVGYLVTETSEDLPALRFACLIRITPSAVLTGLFKKTSASMTFSVTKL